MLTMSWINPGGFPLQGGVHPKVKMAKSSVCRSLTAIKGEQLVVRVAGQPFVTAFFTLEEFNLGITCTYSVDLDPEGWPMYMRPVG